jgi:hypothetical protein
MLTQYDFIVSVATVGNRFTRLKATKHACNRAEVKLIKELGGINPTDYYCTLVALADVERYCEKYNKPDQEAKQCTAKEGLGQQIKKDKRSFRKERSVDNFNSLELPNVSNVSPEQNTPDANKKRKRRTQFELLQSYEFYTEIHEEENHRSVSSDGDEQQLTVDSVMSDINSNIIDGQNTSPAKLSEVKFNYDTLDLPFSDENNNSSGSIEPRSPTLLLKRSENNKWHIAKAALPHLNFDDTEWEKPPDIMKKTVESKIAMTTVKNKLKVPQMSINKSKPFSKKTKIEESVRPLPSIKKLGKKGQKTVNESNKKRKSSATALDEHKTVEGDLISDKNIIDAKSGNTGNASVTIQHKNPDGRKRSFLSKDNTPLLKESTTTLSKTVVVNKEKRENSAKSDNKVVKKKRRGRAEMNTFRLIETIPYPSSLVVKDGDLCPSYTMAYNQKSYLPDCCHALWRWRLGKPVKIPSQSPVKTPDDPSLGEKKQDDAPLVKAKEDYRFSHSIEQDQHSQDKREKPVKIPSQSPVKTPDDPSLGEKKQDDAPLVKAKEDYRFSHSIEQDEHSQDKRANETPFVENKPDERSHPELNPDENSPDKAKKGEIDLSQGQSQQDDDSLFKEKHDELSSIRIIQDKQECGDAINC